MLPAAAAARGAQRSPRRCLGGGSSQQRRCAVGVRVMGWSGPVPHPLGGVSVGRLSPSSALDGRSDGADHHTGLPEQPAWAGPEGCWGYGSGAAGSRTRVPRPRRAGLYVRRFRIISGTVLRSQTASVTHTTVQVFPAARWSVPWGGASLCRSDPPTRRQRRIVAVLCRESNWLSVRVGSCGSHVFCRGHVSTLGTLPWHRTGHGRNRVSPMMEVRIAAVELSTCPGVTVARRPRVGLATYTMLPVVASRRVAGSWPRGHGCPTFHDAAVWSGAAAPRATPSIGRNRPPLE